MSDALPADWRKVSRYCLQHSVSGWKIAVTVHSGVPSFDLWQPPTSADDRAPWCCRGYHPDLAAAVRNHDQLMEAKPA